MVDMPSRADVRNPPPKLFKTSEARRLRITAYRAGHREEIRAKQNAKYRTLHPKKPKRTAEEERERRRGYYLATKERHNLASKQWRVEHPGYARQWREANAERERAKYRQHRAHVEAYRAYLRTVPWFVYVLKYADSGIAFYAGSSMLPGNDRLNLHIKAARKGGSDAGQRDLHAVIRFQILALGKAPTLEKVFVRIPTKKEAYSLEMKTVEVLGTQFMKAGNLVNVHCNGASTPWRKHLLGPWQMGT